MQSNLPCSDILNSFSKIIQGTCFEFNTDIHGAIWEHLPSRGHEVQPELSKAQSVTVHRKQGLLQDKVQGYYHWTKQGDISLAASPCSLLLALVHHHPWTEGSDQPVTVISPPLISMSSRNSLSKQKTCWYLSSRALTRGSLHSHHTNSSTRISQQ